MPKPILSMNREQILATAIVAALGAGLIIFTVKKLNPAPAAGEEAAGNGHDDHADDFERGPHRGRMLREDGFAAEITIFERGVPPRFRVYFQEQDRPVDASDVRLTIELKRLGGRTQVIRFQPEGDYLAGDQTVYEPHSFDVTVTAEHGDRTYHWQYESYEARVELPSEVARNAGIVVETAGPAIIRGTLKVTGRILPNEDRLKHVVPRYPGVLKEVHKRLGDRVERDEVLAVVESNESLQPYPVKSELAGTIIEKHAAPGEFVREGSAIYLVADLSTVWVDLNIHRQDAARVKEGQIVVVGGGDDLPNARGEIAYLSPFGAENTQTFLARVVLPNPDGDWRPGLFVTGEILLQETTAPLAVKAGAVQTFREWTVVFLNEGELYEPLVVETGRRDGEWLEIVSGMDAGQRYVSENSFIIKADILKTAATHDH